MSRTLFGTQSNNCCAYCTYHKCYLTVKQLKGKECLRKQCRNLEKNPEHEYWNERERMKARRLNRRERMEMLISAC